MIKLFILLLQLSVTAVVMITLAIAEEVPPSLIINEIYYDHPGSDTGHEWVELVNVGTEPIEIDTSSASAWRIFDGQNHKLSSTTNRVIVQPKSYVIIAKDPEIFAKDYPTVSVDVVKSSLTLANTGDTLKLSLDGGKTYFSESSYSASFGGAGNDKSLERDDEGWHESSQVGGTPGAQNSIHGHEPTNSPEQNQSIPKSIEPRPNNTVDVKRLESIPIQAVKNLALGDEVNTSGVVTVPPGILSNTTIYIQDETSAIQIYSREFPDLALGDTVSVGGKRSQINGENRITSNKDSVMIASHGDPINPRQISLSSVSLEYEGQLVQVSGILVINGGKVWLAHDQIKIEIVIRSNTSIEKPVWHDNDTLDIIGVVSPYREAIRILPRFQQDINWSPQVKQADEIAMSEEENLALSGTLPEDGQESPQVSTGANNDSTKRESVKSKSGLSKKSQKSTSNEQLKPVINQVKGLFDEKSTKPLDEISNTSGTKPSQSRSTPATNSGLPYTIYGMILGMLGVSLWHNRSSIQKVPVILKNWHGSWRKE